LTIAAPGAYRAIFFFWTHKQILFQIKLTVEPEAPQNNATSRGLHRIDPPTETRGFQTAGSIAQPNFLAAWRESL
jgi:hypothetical protein